MESAEKWGKAGVKAGVILFVFILAVMTLAAGCKPAGDNGYRILTDDFAVIMLAQDQDSKTYDQALEAVVRYMETMGREELEDAREAVDGAIRQMREDLTGVASHEIGDEISDILKNYEMDPEEYKVNADMRTVRLSDYVSKLNNLKSRLDLAASAADQAAAKSGGSNENSAVQTALRDILSFWVSYYTRYQAYMRTYSYYSINYWFCQWDQEKTAYVEEQLLNRLESFKTEDCVWEQDRGAVERKMDLCMDGLEELGHELEAYIGAMQAELID